MRRRDVHTKMGDNGAVVADAVGQQWYVPVCFQSHPYDAVHVAKRGSTVKIKERSMSTGECGNPSIDAWDCFDWRLNVGFLGHGNAPVSGTQPKGAGFPEESRINQRVVLTGEKVSHEAQVAPHRKARQRPGGINAVVRDLGIDRTEARPSSTIATP